MARPIPLAIAGMMLVLIACDGASSIEKKDSGPGTTVSEGTLGPVTATLTKTPESVRFGDRMNLVLTVSGSDAVALEEPMIGARLGHLRVRGQTLTGDAKKGKFSLAMEVEPERTGINIGRLPALFFRVKSGEGAGEERTLTLPSFEVDVAGLPLAERPTLDALGQPLPAVALPKDQERTLWILGAIVVGLLAFGLGFLWWRGHRGVEVKAPPPIDPRLEAKNALAALLAKSWLKEGRYADFYVELTGIVRRFIERTTGVHAPEQTTEEFLRAMEGNPNFAGTQQRDLGSFLEAADLVKFAAQVPGEAEVNGAVGAARRFCQLEETVEVAS